MPNAYPLWVSTFLLIVQQPMFASHMDKNTRCDTTQSQMVQSGRHYNMRFWWKMSWVTLTTSTNYDALTNKSWRKPICNSR